MLSKSRDVWRRLVDAAAGSDGRVVDPHRVCAACVELLEVDGAAITLMVAGGGVGAGYASDPGTQLLQELQFLVGDGPIADAYAGGVPVAEADLAGAGFGRWAGFCRGAVGSGVRAVFSFPLGIVYQLSARRE